jgi:hypothetical protein
MRQQLQSGIGRSDDGIVQATPAQVSATVPIRISNTRGHRSMYPKDFLGREIHPGDLVVYAWRRGSALGLNKLSVQQATPDFIGGYSNTGRKVTITNLKNVVIVTQPEAV